jgi:hypothetical protein
VAVLWASAGRGESLVTEFDRPGKVLNAKPGEQRRFDLDFYMRRLPVDVALRWCEPGNGGCACRGCANNSGGLAREGFTKVDWLQWWIANTPTG